jgi:hypothetical protein
MIYHLITFVVDFTLVCVNSISISQNLRAMTKEDIQEQLEAVETADSTLGMKSTKGIDDASKFMSERDIITWTEEEERQLLRKIDFRILPLVSRVHFDRTILC